MSRKLLLNKLPKLIGIGLVGILGLIIFVGVILYAVGSSRLNKTYEIPLESIHIPESDSAINRGQHLAEALTVCHACHGDNLEGRAFINEPMIAAVYAPNLTSGLGGIGKQYNDNDFVGAIRHGVNPNSRGLMIMHSDIFHNLSKEDLGALIAYIKSIPPVGNEIPVRKILPLGRIMVALGFFDSETVPFIPAEKINHEAPFEKMPEIAPSVAYGKYLMSITMCTMCHGSELKGAPPFEPGMPAGTNITIYNANGGFSKDQFITTIRTGITPSGRELNPEFMPWDIFSSLTDDELTSMWAYISSLQ